MRAILKYSLGLLLLWCAWGCESAMPEYNDPQCGLRFQQVTLDKTFIYDKPDTKEAEVYVLVVSVGHVKNQDRPFRMVQVEAEDKMNAEAGVHYLPVPDSLCIIPAGKEKVLIPVTILNDSSLSKERFVLRLALKDNGYFTVDLDKNTEMDIRISNMLTKPTNWQNWSYGLYGPVKHQFLINISGKKWDWSFFNELSGNYNYNKFWQNRAKKELKKENERLQQQGEGPLREEPEPDYPEGRLVDFTPVY